MEKTKEDILGMCGTLQGLIGKDKERNEGLTELEIFINNCKNGIFPGMKKELSK